MKDGIFSQRKIGLWGRNSGKWWRKRIGERRGKQDDEGLYPIPTQMKFGGWSKLPSFLLKRSKWFATVTYDLVRERLAKDSTQRKSRLTRVPINVSAFSSCFPFAWVSWILPRTKVRQISENKNRWIAVASVFVNWWAWKDTWSWYWSIPSCQ